MTNKSDWWLALMIGNTRLHWAWFKGDLLYHTWDCEHFTSDTIDAEIARLNIFPEDLPIYIASVVPEQTKLWSNYPLAKVFTLEQIPLKRVYPTLGIDRALALWGAGVTYGFPCLVIDGGTALTFSGVNGKREFMGGAILPGLRLQLKSLAENTAVLPQLQLPIELPPRWANSTSEAIMSGVIYTVMTTIKTFSNSWLKRFPDTKILLTGGDALLIMNYLEAEFPELSTLITINKDLIFCGMTAVFKNISL